MKHKMLLILLLCATPAFAGEWDMRDDMRAFHGNAPAEWSDPAYSSAGPYRAGDRYITKDNRGRVTSDITIEQVNNHDPYSGSRIQTYDRVTRQRNEIIYKPSEE